MTLLVTGTLSSGASGASAASQLIHRFDHTQLEEGQSRMVTIRLQI